MKVGLRWVLAGALVLVLIGAIVGVVMGWPTGGPGPYAEGPDSPHLIVQPKEQAYMMAEMKGSLGVNEQHCVTLGGDVMIAPYGTRVTPDGRHVSFPGWAPIRLGTSLVGGGGYFPALDDMGAMHVDDEFVKAIATCLGADPDTSEVQFWLSRD